MCKLQELFGPAPPVFCWVFFFHPCVLRRLVPEQNLKKVLPGAARGAAKISRAVLTLHTHRHDTIITSPSIKNGRTRPSIRVTEGAVR